MEIIWTKAAGSCGFHVDQREVEAAMINGRALFVFENPLSSVEAPLFTCVVMGLTASHHPTMQAAKLAGEGLALRTIFYGRTLTGMDFCDLIGNPQRLHSPTLNSDEALP